MLGRVGAFGGLIALAGGIMGYQAIDLKLNYTLVPARIISMDQECFIENSGSKVAEADSERMAYFPCSEAPAIATEFGYGNEDIHTRTQFEYNYYSPVDGAVYTGKMERKDAAEDMIVGREISVYASDTEPTKSKTTSSNWFIGDTGV